PSPVITDETESKPQLPTVDQILAKYITALGGEQAMRKVTTRVITATQEVPTGPGGTIPVPAKLERSLKAPNLVLDVYVADTFTVSDGFDGTTQWTKGQNGVVDASHASHHEREGQRADRGRDVREADAQAATSGQIERGTDRPRRRTFVAARTDARWKLANLDSSDLSGR